MLPPAHPCLRSKDALGMPSDPTLQDYIFLISYFFFLLFIFFLFIRFTQTHTL